ATVKTKLDSILATTTAAGLEPRTTVGCYETIVEGCSFRAKTVPLAVGATQILYEDQPMTLPGLFYRVGFPGVLPSTDRQHYDALGRVMTSLRERGVVPFEWLVDGVRRTLKPSSWSGLEDFSKTVREAYRKNFWASLPEYVHVFVEKDAMSGVIYPVT